MRKFLLSLCLGIFCGMPTAHAANYWHVNATIVMIYPYWESNSDGSFVLAFSPNNSTCTGAGTPKLHYVRVGQNGMTENTAKNLFSTAMLAVSLGKPIDVLFDNATANCYVKAIKIYF